MIEPKDTWESLGDVTARVFARIEEDQRRIFEKTCRDDGVLTKKAGEKVSEQA